MANVDRLRAMLEDEDWLVAVLSALARLEPPDWFVGAGASPSACGTG